MKKRLITPLLLLLVLLLNIRCSEEEIGSNQGEETSEAEQVEIDGPTVNHSRTSLQDVPLVESLIAEKVMGKNQFLSLRTHHLDEFGEFEIDQEEVLIITDSLDVKNYAIRLKGESSNPLAFYNIIVTQDENGDFLEPILAEYLMDMEFYLDWVQEKNEIKDFLGNVYYYDLDPSTFSKTGKGISLDARGGDGPPCPSFTFGSTGTSAPNLGNIYCWTYVSYGLCDVQISNTDLWGTSFHTGNNCGIGEGSEIYGYGTVCGGSPTSPPDINTARKLGNQASRCGGSSSPGPRPGGVPISPGTPGMADIGSIVGFIDNKVHLTSQQEAFLERDENIEFTLAMRLFLKFENTSQTRAFCKAAVIAKMQGNVEVNFTEKIISKLSGKAKRVYDKLKQTSLTELGIMQNTYIAFNPNLNYQEHFLTYKTGPLSGSAQTINANTKYISSRTYEITLRDTYVRDASEIEIARTILHESIHAMLLRHYTGSGQQSFIDIFRTYINQQTGMNDLHHDIMRDKSVLPIAKGLQLFDCNKESFSFYVDLAWAGLHQELDAAGLQRMQNAITKARTRGSSGCN